MFASSIAHLIVSWWVFCGLIESLLALIIYTSAPGNTFEVSTLFWYLNYYNFTGESDFSFWVFWKLFMQRRNGIMHCWFEDATGLFATVNEPIWRERHCFFKLFGGYNFAYCLLGRCRIVDSVLNQHIARAGSHTFPFSNVLFHNVEIGCGIGISGEHVSRISMWIANDFTGWKHQRSFARQVLQLFQLVLFLP